jgi:hypothetical protein
VLVLRIGASAASPQDYRSSLVVGPYSVSFGEVPVGKTTDSQTITLLNTGSTGSQIDKITVTDDSFSQTNNCPLPAASLAKNQTCGVTVTFTPKRPGPASGTVSVLHDRNPNPLKVSLTGSGTLNASAVTFSPSSLNFDEQKEGTPSMLQQISMSNTGQKTLLVSSIAVDGDFTIMPGSTCESLQGSLAAGSSCTVVVTFTPLGIGKRQGELTFTDDAPDSPQGIALTGIGKQ